MQVMLISLKAGGVALNLTVASRIFLMGKICYFVYNIRFLCTRDDFQFLFFVIC